MSGGRYVAALIVTALVYFVMGRAGLEVASVNPSASPIWVPSAIGLAVLLLFGLRITPAVFAGALFVNLTTKADISAAIIALGNTAEGVVMAILVGAFCGGLRAFETPGRVARFAAITLGSGTLIAATNGVTSLCLNGDAPWQDFGSIWVTWWFGDSAGALVATPAIVLWIRSILKRDLNLNYRNIAVFAAAVMVGVIAFSPLLPADTLRAPLAFLAVIPLLASALRLGPRDTATVALILAVFAVWGTLNHVGPFVQADVNAALLLLGGFIVATTVPSLALSAEVAQHHHTESALRIQEDELRALFRQALVGIAECDKDGVFLVANEQFYVLTRMTEKDLIGRRMHDLTDGDDLEREAQLFGRAAAAGQGYVIEKRLLRPDGSRPWVRNTVTPIVDHTGKVSRVAIMCEDITQRHNDEERQRLLMAELNHRVRNNLATIQAMARLTARGPTTKEQYVESLQGRIASMARTHSLLTRDRWQGASLEDIVRDELNAYGRPDAITIQGPSIMLGTRHAIDLALVIHELATNAVKYGSLSGPSGRVSVTWVNQIVGGEPHLMLRWQESGGPEVAPPAKKGFGSYLIESALAGGNTKVTLAYPPEGVTCDIDMPLVRSATHRASPPPPPQAGTTRQRILLVEDDAVLGFELQSALLEAGLEVVGPARTVQEALALAGDKTLAGAVLDIHLGGLMVFPVAEYLRARELPMLFITGYDIEAVAPETLRDTPVMQKPVNAEKLAGRLRELIGTGERS